MWSVTLGRGASPCQSRVNRPGTCRGDAVCRVDRRPGTCRGNAVEIVRGRVAAAPRIASWIVPRVAAAPRIASWIVPGTCRGDAVECRADRPGTCVAATPRDASWIVGGSQMRSRSRPVNAAGGRPAHNPDYTPASLWISARRRREPSHWHNYTLKKLSRRAASSRAFRRDSDLAAAASLSRVVTTRTHHRSPLVSPCTRRARRRGGRRRWPAPGAA